LIISTLHIYPFLTDLRRGGGWLDGYPQNQKIREIRGISTPFYPYLL